MHPNPYHPRGHAPDVQGCWLESMSEPLIARMVGDIIMRDGARRSDDDGNGLGVCRLDVTSHEGYVRVDIGYRHEEGGESRCWTFRAESTRHWISPEGERFLPHEPGANAAMDYQSYPAKLNDGWEEEVEYDLSCWTITFERSGSDCDGGYASGHEEHVEQGRIVCSDDHWQRDLAAEAAGY
jgi:hypothetical protein